MSRFAVLAAGGTGGHMFPAQSLAEELLRRGWRVALATDKRGLGYAGGFPQAVERRALKSATPARGGLTAGIAAPIALLSGTREALKWFRYDRPDAVIGFGGYPAAPATAAAILLRIPRIIHEQNAVLGRANRLFVRHADILACGTGKPVNTPRNTETVLTGNPVRSAVLSCADKAYVPPDGNGTINLLVFGGSQGAKALSEAVPHALAQLPEEFKQRLDVTLQVRGDDLNEARKVFEQAEISAQIAPFFEDMPQRIAAAQLVIARAGASTCAELTVLGRPSILMPLPGATGDHQTANARAVSENGGAVLLPQSDLSPETLCSELTALMGDPARLETMATAAKALGKPDAAGDLADLVERYVTCD